MIKDIIVEIFKYLELNDNENVIYQNLWGAVKVIFRGKNIYPQLLLPEKKKKVKISFETIEKDKGGRMNKDKNKLIKLKI